MENKSKSTAFLNSLKPFEQTNQTIVVSKGAYLALKLLVTAIKESGHEFVKFPELEGKYAFINELTKMKGVLKKRGDRLSAEYALKVPFEHVRESARKTKEFKVKQTQQKISPERQVSKEPTTHRRKPTLDQMSEFIGAVIAQSKELSKDKHDQLTLQIKDIKRRLTDAEGDEEKKLIQQLTDLQYQRQTHKGQTAVEALSNVASEERFRAIDWTQCISFEPRDYVSE